MDSRTDRSPPARSLALRPWAVAVAMAPLLAACSFAESPAPPAPAPSAALRPALPASVARTLPGVSGARTVLPGTLSPLARPERSTGRMDPSRVLSGASLLLQPSPAQVVLSRAVLADLQDPTSSRYRHWLSPDEVASSFGAAPEDLARLGAWLDSQGLSVLGASRTAMRLSFTGSVGQIEQAFRTEMHEYDVDGARHFALAVPPSVPSELAPVVLGLRGVHDFHPPSPRRPATAEARPGDLWPSPLADGGVNQVLTLAPVDWAAIYDVTPLYEQGFTGAGQKLAVLGFSDYNDADIAAFRTAFGLDASNLPTRALVPNSGNPFFDGTYGWFGEAELDLEWSGAVARDASITYVFTGDNDAYDIWDALFYAVDLGAYPIISASYSDCEPSYSAMDLRFTQILGDVAAMEGSTLLAAAGDWGAAQCDAARSPIAGAALGYSVAWPASIPSVVGVGGTELSWGQVIPEPVDSTPSPAYWGPSDAGYSAKGYIPEMGWNELELQLTTRNYFWGAGGGGVSTLYPMPYWQQGQVPSGTYRRVPDVAMTAAYAQVGYLMSSSWSTADGDSGAPYAEELYPTGGTSAATPSLAGLLTLVNQATGSVGFGNLNPILYALNASTTGTPDAAFHDITTGNNVVPCQQGTPSCPSSPPYAFGYSAGPGYDMVTGIGSVDAAHLAAALTVLSPTTTTLQVGPSGSTEGSPVTLTATIASTSISNAMTGQVTFTFVTMDDGYPSLSILASAEVQSIPGAHEGGTATVTTVAPPGLTGTASVVASYGGDAHYRASWSDATAVGTASAFAVVPTAITLRPGQIADFTASGGTAPFAWIDVGDSTCNDVGCSVVQSVSATTAAFQAGPTDGKATVLAIDADGAESKLLVTVSGSPVDGGALPPPWDGATPVDAGEPDGGGPEGGGGDAHGSPDASEVDASTAAPDAATPTEAPDAATPTEAPDAAAPTEAPDAAASMDAATTTNAGGPTDSSASTTRADAAPTGYATPPANGCSCAAAGAEGDRERAPGSLGLLLVGLVAARRRRSGSRG